jgi:hypothetical protein
VNVTTLPLPAAPPSAAASRPVGPAAGEPGSFAALLDGALAGGRAAESDEAPSAPGAEAAENGADIAGAAAVIPTDVNRVDRTMEGLHPAFRDRLGRVIQRMEAEFGHQVRVVETLRTQERQDHLYAQGRTRPGPIVTWTRNSNHLTGRAADVLIDGSYNNPAGYARLAQVAQEEGLRTLGPRDPGHIELPRSFGDADRHAPHVVPRLPGEVPMHLERVEQPARPIAHSGGLAQVAAVAQVARVAEVAQVARVAQPAAAAELQGQRFAASAPRRGERSEPAILADARAALSAFAAADASGESGLSRVQAIRAAAESRGDDAGAQGGERGEWMTALAGRSISGSATAAPVAGGFGVDVAARVARVLEMQEGASARPLSSILLRLDNPAGGEDRIRVDLRGNSVDAQLDLQDPAEAQRLGARIGDLKQALERQGLDAEALRVRASTLRPDAAEAVRVAAALADEAPRPAARTSADAQGHPQRGRTPDPEHDDAGSRRSRQQHPPETEDPT